MINRNKIRRRDIKKSKISRQNISKSKQIKAGQKQRGGISRERFALYKPLIDTIPELVYFKDMMGRHFMVNKAFAEFVGLGEAQIIDKTDEQIFPPELAERFASSDREVIKNGKTICIKEEIAYKNRGTLFFETVKSPLYDEQGERVGVIGVTRDTTDHRTAERESQLFKSLINRLNDAIFVVDPETSRFLDVNDKACSSLGYIRDEFLRMKVIDIEAIFPKTSFWERHVKEVKKQGCMVLEGVHKRKDGEIFPVEVNVSFITLHGHDYMVAVARDVTERKRVEGVLQKERNYLEKLHDSLGDAVFTIKLSERVISFANSLVESIFGYRPWECIGLATAVLYPDEMSFHDFGKKLEEAIKSQMSILRTEHLLKRKNGEIFPAHITVTFLKVNNEVTNAISIVRDITELKRADEHLKYRLTFEGIITSISTQFINLALEDIDAGINNALQIIGEFANVDRSYISLFSYDGAKIDNIHEWCRKGISPRINNLKGFSVENFPWSMKKLKELEVIHIYHISALPPEAGAEKEILKAQDIKSLVIVPMVYGRNLIGFLGFDSVRMEQTWSEDIIALLKIVGENFANIIKRKEIEGELHRLNEELEQLVIERTSELKEMNRQLKDKITAHEGALNELQLFRSLINQSNDAVVVVEPETGRFLDFNDRAYIDLGFSRDEFSRMKVYDVEIALVQDSSSWKMYVEELKKGGGMLREAVGRRKDGTTLSVEVNARYLIFNNREYIIAVIRDVTERKRMEQDLSKIEKLESLGVLAGGIAHDFNNVLAGILGNISLAKMNIRTDDKISKILTESEKACFRAKELAQQLITFSKGGAPIKKTISIAELIKDSTTFTLSGSKVKPEFSIPEDLWPVEVDEGQISQVINNIVLNADQAMPEGGIVEVRCENTIIEEDTVSLKKGRYVNILVKDYGGGIAKENLQKIFDPYFTTKEKGSGLGLSTVYSIVKNHGGYITVGSELGKGTTFCVYLPSTKKNIIKRVAQKEEYITGRGRILLMDDEELIRTVTGEMLMKLGYEVELAEDGAKAVDVYRKAKESGKPFDAVIMDLTIPGGMGGKDAIKKLLEIDPAIKAIVSSGYSDDPIMADYKKYGFKGCIAKPYKMAEVSRIVNEVIRGEEMN